MQIKLLAFGIARDILGQQEVRWEASQPATVAQLRQQLYSKYPALNELRSLAIAVNEEYAEENHGLRENDEVVLIPPVSGG